jgi:uncharacterized repeat protein (TIGR03803 family)
MTKLKWGKGACALFILCVATAIVSPAQTFNFRTVHQFGNGEGGFPAAGLVQATDGNLYGTTEGGGAQMEGTVFKIAPSGALTTLHSFCANPRCPDGENPQAPLIQAIDGNLYGTTPFPGGTVFKITPAGTQTVVSNAFSQIVAPLVQGRDGNFYGATANGGPNIEGTIFKLTPSGTVTTLHTFCLTDCADGKFPQDGLVQGTDGNYYGTTQYGGVNNCSLGCGTVFKITPSGTLTTLYSFCALGGGCADGSNSVAGLVQGTDGNFYGTTYYGGPNTCDNPSHGSVSCGTVFKITPAGVLTTLHSFDSSDGGNPSAGLVQGSDGNFYGTTLYGGANGTNDGTVFKITPSGTLTTLYSFCSQSSCADGSQSYATLIQDTNGFFYGTTSEGGLGNGTVFGFSVGLASFVKVSPPARKVGTTVKILGTNLSGSTRVTFNGKLAAFSVSSKTFITATVPAGATTGTVQVTTPGGTLSSNVPFQVLP